MTVVAALLALLSIAGGALVVLRLPRKDGAAVADERPTGMAGESLGVPARARGEDVRSRADGIWFPTTDRPARATSEVTAIAKRNLMILEHREQLLEEADERAFQSLRLPEPLCTLVRRVNDEWAEKRRSVLSGPIGAQTPEQAIASAEAANAELDRTRRVALANVLEATNLQELEAAEDAESSRLRERFRGWEERVGGTGQPRFDLAGP